MAYDPQRRSTAGSPVLAENLIRAVKRMLGLVEDAAEAVASAHVEAVWLGNPIWVSCVVLVDESARALALLTYEFEAAM